MTENDTKCGQYLVSAILTLVGLVVYVIICTFITEWDGLRIGIAIFLGVSGLSNFLTYRSSKGGW